ncbi:MAG: MBL fold metallo-hydrolase [Symbiobacteriia bacterium]
MAAAPKPRPQAAGVPGAADLPAGVHLIPIPTPFPVGDVNLVLLEGTPLTLIDAGPRYEPARQALAAGLAALGYRLEDIEQLVLTHFHADHSGLAAEIRQRSGCRVLAHPNTEAWLKPGSGNFRADYLVRLFTRNGGTPEATAEVRRAIGDIWSYADALLLDGYLNEGDTLLAGGRTFTVLHTPGHAYGHICLWQPEWRGLIAGDHLLQHISSNAMVDPIEPGSEVLVRSLPLYLQGLERVAAMNPDWVAAAHGAVIRDARALVTVRRSRTERRLEQVRRALQPGPATVYQVARQLFPRLDGDEQYLGVSEVLGHLFLLEDRGEVLAAGEPIRWRLLA